MSVSLSQFDLVAGSRTGAIVVIPGDPWSLCAQVTASENCAQVTAWTVTASTIGAYTVTIGAIVAAYTVTGGETITAIRDALIASYVAQATGSEGVTVIAAGDGQILATGTAGALFAVGESSPSAEITRRDIKSACIAGNPIDLTGASATLILASADGATTITGAITPAPLDATGYFTLALTGANTQEIATAGGCLDGEAVILLGGEEWTPIRATFTTEGAR